MKDYRLFDLTDFVMDEDFTRWVFMNEEQDRLFWENWLRQNPDRHLIVSEARRILESMKMDEHAVPVSDIQAETDRLLQTLGGQSVPQSLPVRRMTRYRRWWYAAAAFLLLAAGAEWLLTARHPAATRFSYQAITAQQRLVEHTNTTGSTVTITLDDGTTVQLAPNGRLGYATGFDTAATRDVYLSGQAFFKVTKNPRRPFRVFSNEIVTRVLGTSFLVRSYENDTTIQVIVRTGKVSVYSQAAAAARPVSNEEEPGSYILTPNQQLVYEKAGQKFQKILLQQPELISATGNVQAKIYEDAPVEHVFDDLVKDYGINIVYDSELLRKCTVTADLRNESFYDRLDLICKAVGARYEVIDGQVVIQANGCD